MPDDTGRPLRRPIGLDSDRGTTCDPTHDDYECCQGTGWLENENEVAGG